MGKRLLHLLSLMFLYGVYALIGLPLENTALSIVPPMRKGNCNLPSLSVAPDSLAIVLVKKLSH
jgi:hypothetical protein